MVQAAQVVQRGGHFCPCASAVGVWEHSSDPLKHLPDHEVLLWLFWASGALRTRLSNKAKLTGLGVCRNARSWHGSQCPASLTARKGTQQGTHGHDWILLHVLPLSPTSGSFLGNFLVGIHVAWPSLLRSPYPTLTSLLEGVESTQLLVSVLGRGQSCCPSLGHLSHPLSNHTISL
jgi:hypothetical protein